MDDARKILYDYLIELITNDKERKAKIEAEIELELDKLFKEDVDG